MEQETRTSETAAGEAHGDLRGLIREVIEEYTRKESAKAEPAYRNELAEERRRREQLERRVNELIQENARSRQAAEEAEKSAAIRAELQRLGVVKVDLAFRALKDEIQRSEDGRLVAATERGMLGLRDYLTQFVHENPEFLPARNLGGSGITSTTRAPSPASVVELETIKPGMSAEELKRVRQEIARIASQALGGA